LPDFWLFCEERSRPERERERRFRGGGGELSAADSELPHIWIWAVFSQLSYPCRSETKPPAFLDLRSLADLDRWLDGMV